jgi:hypothetical protein
LANLYTDPSQQSIQQVNDVSSDTSLVKQSLAQAARSPSKSVVVGGARFRTPGPARTMTIIDDPLRYLKK